MGFGQATGARDAPAALVTGPASVDRYVATGQHLPGGGALNVAWHWSQLDLPSLLVTRIAAAEQVRFTRFVERHRIAVTPSWVVAGAPCTVDVVIGSDRQPLMDNFVEGVWADFELTPDELELMSVGTPTHLVLADPVDRALLRHADALPQAYLTGDFLSFRHFDIDRFASTFRHLGVGFVGWTDSADHPLIAALGHHAERFGNVLVVTLGARGVIVFDGRSGTTVRHDFDVYARRVVGSTVGCGDAFIAAFLAEWFGSREIEPAVEAGKRRGADATAWDFPLPDLAYC